MQIREDKIEENKLFCREPIKGLIQTQLRNRVLGSFRVKSHNKTPRKRNNFNDI